MSENRFGSTSDYCLMNVSPEQRLSRFEHLTLVGGRELERAIAWLAKQIAGFSLEERLGILRVDHLLEAADFYDNFTRSVPGSGFFHVPTRPPLVDKRAIHGMPDGFVYDLLFDSAYAPQHPDYHREYELFEENRKVHARYWQHIDAGAIKGTIIAIHGWTMGDQRINSLAFQPGYFYREGYDIVMMELPFHGRRTPVQAGDKLRVSLFPSANFIRTNEAICQSISDLRLLRWYLALNGAPRIGVMGMSLGGYVASLWASLDSMEYCIPIVPMVSMSELAWGILSSSAGFAELQDQGLSFELLDRVYRLHAPLEYQPKVVRQNVLILAGIGDRVVPPGQPTLLWRHWQQPQMFWFKGGHLAEFRKSRAFATIVRFLSSIS